MAQYSFEQRPGESIEGYYKRIAKVADQRLVRLEQLSSQAGYGNAKQWAYARAMRDIESWSGEGARRFNTKAPSDINAMRAKINDIKAFLGSESSTKSGITTVYKNRVDTINKKYGTSFQVDDIAQLFSDGLMKKLEKNAEAGSDQIMRAIGYIYRKAPDEEALAALQKEARKRSTVPTFTGDPILDSTIGKILRSKSTISNMHDMLFDR